MVIWRRIWMWSWKGPFESKRQFRTTPWDPDRRWRSLWQKLSETFDTWRQYHGWSATWTDRTDIGDRGTTLAILGHTLHTHVDRYMRTKDVAYHIMDSDLHRSMKVNQLDSFKVGSICLNAPVRRVGCGGLLVRTDCVRWWRWQGPHTHKRKSPEQPPSSKQLISLLIELQRSKHRSPQTHASSRRSRLPCLINIKQTLETASHARAQRVNPLVHQSLSVILAKTSLTGLILIILSTYQTW